MSTEAKRKYRASAHGKAKAREYYLANKEAYRARGRRYKTGCTPEMFDALMIRQAGRCAMSDCLIPFTGDGDVTADHDHSTGAVRGLLCQQCNLKLGQWEAPQARVAAFKEYLHVAKL